MAGWRGRTGALVPPGLLRRAIDITHRHPPGGPQRSTRAIRAGSADAAAEAARATGLAAAQVPWRGELWTVVSAAASGEGAGLQEIAAFRRRLLERGLRVVDEPARRVPVNASAAWRVLDPAAGARPDVAEALAGPVAFMPAGQEHPAAGILDVEFPVDAVYTWVDGSDPAWRARREAHASDGDGNPRTANDEARFATRDELRFSLRSLDYFAPWINHVYLVTDQQVPPWLDRGGRITVVDHRDIFEDATHLPTFNSHAIESQLHRIPGLSEHFVYINDDVFLGRRTAAERLFTAAGQSRFFLSGQRIAAPGERALPVDVAASNNRALLERRFGRSAGQKFKHAVHAQVRSTLEAIAREHPEEVARTAAARFRSASDLSIPSALAHYYGAGLGTAVSGEIDYCYVDLGDERAQLLLARLLWRRPPEMFCLNEVAARPGRERETAAMLAHFLETAYPFASVFERDTAGAGDTDC